MPNKHRDTGTNPTPHFDGKREGVLNDPKGVEIGITMDSETPMKNPVYIPQGKSHRIEPNSENRK